MTIKELWGKATTENGVLTLEQFEALAKENNVKFADVTDGKYVSVNKYNDDLKAKDTQIEGLNKTIQTRDEDLSALQTKLGEAGTDANKLTELNNSLSELQTKYDTETQQLKDQLAKQNYEFMVREFAASKQFTSNAAKRDFINQMIDRGLKVSKDGKSIMGAEDFVTEYSGNNADAFVTESQPQGTPDDIPPAQPAAQQFPQFVAPTQGSNDTNGDPTGGFANAFHFATVRPMPEAK